MFGFFKKRPDIERFRSVLDVKPNVLVLGSAPRQVRPHAIGSDWDLFSVNASQVIAEPWGLSPVLTLFGSALMRGKETSKAAQAALRGRRTGTLIWVTDNDPKAAEAFARGFDYGYGRILMMPKRDRIAILERQTGESWAIGDHPSNGFFLAILATFLGASRVVMTGFSFSVAGHAYNDLNLPRKHLDHDARLVRAILARGLPIATNDPVFATESGLPLVKI